MQWWISKQDCLSTNTWFLRIKKVTDYVLSWKSNGAYNSKLKLLYTAFLNSKKPSRYKMGIKFDKDPLVVEENNYLTKIANGYSIWWRRLVEVW